MQITRCELYMNITSFKTEASDKNYNEIYLE